MPKFLSYNSNNKNAGLNDTLACPISSSEYLQWRWRTERHLTLLKRGWEMAAENIVYPLGSVSMGGQTFLE